MHWKGNAAMIFRDKNGSEFHAILTGVTLNGEPLFSIGAVINSSKMEPVITRKRQPKPPGNPPFVSRVVTPLIKPMG